MMARKRNNPQPNPDELSREIRGHNLANILRELATAKLAMQELLSISGSTDLQLEAEVVAYKSLSKTICYLQSQLARA